MRQLILLVAILFSSASFAQNTGSILGIVLDGESYNEPLTYANIAVEGTSLEAYADSEGLFRFENLENGNYTLVFRFGGYETKMLNVKVASDRQTNISASLVARTISFADLTSLDKAEAINYSDPKD